MNEITIGDKVYISAKRAAEITGYARDYVGQLCREGHIDAKMVGRSWYVYEPSIRAHRFGVEAQEIPAEAPIVAPVVEEKASGLDAEASQGVSEWQKPTYTAEKPELLPELESPRLEELLPPAEETLTDMQSAWREWFEQRQTELETPEIESPEVIDERNAEPEVQDEVSIPLHHLEPDEEPAPAAESAPEAEEIVPIRPITPAPVTTVPVTRSQSLDIAPRYTAEPTAPEHGRVVSERIVSPEERNRRKKGKPRSYAPAIAALVGLSFVSIAITAIGTGYATRYLQASVAKNNPAINFLVGAREFNRQ